TRPKAVPAIERTSDSFVSPPRTAIPNSRTHSSIPMARPRRNSTSVSAGIDRAATKPSGRAPAAAMSLRFTAVAYHPICCGVAPASSGRGFRRLPWPAPRPDRDRDDCDDHGDDPGEQEGIAQETSKESGGADRDVAPEVPISVEPRSVGERAGLVSNREVELEVAPERAGIGVALVRVDDRVVVVVDE